jgi:hypothetical protein
MDIGRRKDCKLVQNIEAGVSGSYSFAGETSHVYQF